MNCGCYSIDHGITLCSPLQVNMYHNSTKKGEILTFPTVRFSCALYPTASIQGWLVLPLMHNNTPYSILHWRIWTQSKQITSLFSWPTCTYWLIIMTYLHKVLVLVLVFVGEHVAQLNTDCLANIYLLVRTKRKEWFVCVSITGSLSYFLNYFYFLYIFYCCTKFDFYDISKYGNANSSQAVCTLNWND